MKTDDFDYVRHFVRAEAAIVLESDKEYLVESRLHALARKENFATIDLLVQQMRKGVRNGLHRKVVDAMTTNETLFFRDIHPFEALRKTILPNLLARRRPERQINFWCGAASSGQEPFSVLMLIAEHFPELLGWNFKFVATDLCADVLARAKKGRFNQLEVNRGLPAALLVKYFVQQGLEWEFREDLRRRVDFREMNLVKDWPVLPSFDIIFLRNVLIYFDVETKRTVFARIRRVLRSDGCLLLGGAETTLNVDEAFERVALEKTSYYQVKPTEEIAAMIDLDHLIQQAAELEPLRQSTVRLAELVRQPSCHLDDVAELVAFDHALTVKLLRAANSAASGSAVPIGNAQEVVMRLGTAQVLSLAVACGVKSFLQGRIPAYGLDEGALWRHSVAAAVAAETAPSYCQVEVPPETFTAALLHDVGKLVMGRFISPEILNYVRRAQEVEHLGQLEAESLLLSVNHAELGGLIAQHWQLPPRVVQGIIYHHNPEQGLDVVCDLTYLANLMAKRIESGLDGTTLEVDIQPEVGERLGLDAKALEKFFRAASARYADVSRRYNTV